MPGDTQLLNVFSIDLIERRVALFVVRATVS